MLIRVSPAPRGMSSRSSSSSMLIRMSPAPRGMSSRSSSSSSSSRGERFLYSFLSGEHFLCRMFRLKYDSKHILSGDRFFIRCRTRRSRRRLHVNSSLIRLSPTPRGGGNSHSPFATAVAC